MTIQTQFKVAAISKNANSFGLYGVIIIAKDGTTFQLGMSMFNRPNEGDILDCTIGATTGNLLGIPGRNYEIPQKLTDAPYTVVKALWQQKKTA